MAAGVVAAAGWTALLLQLAVAVTRDSTFGNHDEASNRRTTRTAQPPEVDATTGPAPANAARVAAHGGPSPVGTGETAPGMDDGLPGEPFALLHGILFRREPAASTLDAILRGTWDDSGRAAAPLRPPPRGPPQ